MKNKVVDTNTIELVKNVCDYVQENAKVIGLIGEPGNGKTTSWEHAVKQKGDYRRVIITVGASFQPIHLYRHILLALKPRARLNSLDMYELIREIAKIINKSEKNYLIIIDEASKLSAKCLEYFHELFSITYGKVGFIFSGVRYFRTNLDSWIESKRGMAEFLRRVNDWLEIDNPTGSEMATFCHDRGINDDIWIEKLVRECNNFSKILNRIEQQRIEGMASKNKILRTV